VGLDGNRFILSAIVAGASFFIHSPNTTILTDIINMDSIVPWSHAGPALSAAQDGRDKTNLLSPPGHK
jgi:hypothetical protein